MFRSRATAVLRAVMAPSSALSGTRSCGEVTNGSQQQYGDSDLNGWSNGVWNQVFCGGPDAPARDFGVSGGQPYTTYLYTDSAGNYNVFVPSSGQRGDHGSSGAHPQEPRQAA